MVNRLLTSQNCLITGPIIDYLGLLRRIILKNKWYDLMVVGLFPSQAQDSGMTFL